MRNQTAIEDFNTFVNDLKKLAVNCDFKEMKDDMIRNRIVCSIRDVQVKQRLLRDGCIDAG